MTASRASSLTLKLMNPNLVLVSNFLTASGLIVGSLTKTDVISPKLEKAFWSSSLVVVDLRFLVKRLVSLTDLE
jgi:hypothetical protein